MKTTEKKKLSKKEIMRMRKRRRERRLYVCTAVFATLCVFASVGMILLIRSSADKLPGDIAAAQPNVEIAAPEYAIPGGAIIVETEKPTFPPLPTVLRTQEPTPEPFEFIVPAETAAPAVTPEPTAEPTAEPTPVATPEPVDQPTPEPLVTLEPSIPEVGADLELPTITITAAGDCTLGGDYNSVAHERFDSYVEDKGYDYFLENVRYIFEADDITFVNLEGPLTTGTDKRSGRKFNFKGAPEYAQILSGSSVELAGLANNHALDFGKEGLTDTAESLEAVGLGYCGYTTAWRDNVNGFRVTCLSVTEWDYSISQLWDMVVAERANCDLLMVMIHWGEEREYDATDSQEEYGRALIDAGADLVLGSHSHVVGGIEEYKGKYIVYGLGNFCFGGNKNPGDKDCLIFQQTFALNYDGGVSDAGISIIPCSVSSASDHNDYRPTPLAGTEAARVLRKIGRYSSLDLDSVVWLPEMDVYLAELQ